MVLRPAPTHELPHLGKQARMTEVNLEDRKACIAVYGPLMGPIIYDHGQTNSRQLQRAAIKAATELRETKAQLERALEAAAHVRADLLAGLPSSIVLYSMTRRAAEAAVSEGAHVYT